MRPILARHRALVMVLATLLLGPGSHLVAAQTADPQEQLWEAAKLGDTATVAAALKKGARVDSLDMRRNPNGRRALNWAALYNRPAVIRILVAQGATVNVANLTGFTPLHHAAETGSVDAARVLLELGADWTWPNNEGLLPIDVARERGHLEIVALLDSLPAK